MNQYQKQNAAAAIEGYYLPRPDETANQRFEQTFARAKAEALQHMSAAMLNVEALTAAAFFEARGSGILNIPPLE